MAVRTVFRRFFRILLVVIGIHAIVILGLHIWFVNNARGVLRQIVTEKSGGKLKLKLSKLSFDFFSNKLQIREADLESTDTLSAPATYHVTFRKLTLRINSFWPLVLQKRLLLDSIKLHDPMIHVMLWRKDSSSRQEKDDLSIPQEMGKLYNSMLDVLDGFGIRLIVINNATLSLVNKMKPDSKPVTISNVYLEVLRTTNRSFKGEDVAHGERSVDLRTTNQNIDLPGGRHQLSFKTLRLQLFRRYIELDSCIITAKPSKDFKSSYKIFFSKLLLLGVDFNAMYRENLIRADSVYCENPLFDFDLVPSEDVSKRKERPDPEKIVRELSGNLDLAFVGVKNAGIRININGIKRRSLFNSNKDNFEMRGLRINADSSEPVTVEQFDMLVRDYRLYNEDSSTTYSFDSVTFKNNKVALNNFSVTTTSGRNTPRSYRDYKIPYFELTGLDWYQLVFDETLQAREAVLYNPVIHYTRNQRSVRRKKMNLFESLQNIDNLVTLNKIIIINGQINMKVDPSTSFNFRNVDLSLYSDKLLKSTNKEGLRRAVDHFTFSKGFLKLRDVTAELHNVRYTDSNLIHADRLSVRSTSGKISAEVNDVFLDNMLMDDEIDTVIVQGLRWKDAVVKLSSLTSTQQSKRGASVEFRNISGNNTQLTLGDVKRTISTDIHSLQIASLTKERNRPLKVTGFLAKGNNFSIVGNPMKFKTGEFQLSGDGASFISDMSMERTEGRDSLRISSPRIDFSANINDLLAGNIHIQTVQAKAPDISFSKWEKQTPANEAGEGPTIRIDRFVATDPSLHVASHRNDSVTVIDIPRSDKSKLTASDIVIGRESIQLGLLAFNTNSATVIKANGEKIGVEKGVVDVQLSSLEYSMKNGKPTWSGLINKLYLDNPRSMQIGKTKNRLFLTELSLGNLRLSSDYLSDFNQLLKYNLSAWLRSATGEYIDSVRTMKWYNAGFDNKSKTLSLDSFKYSPTSPRDSVIANTPYQTDYVTFQSGSIQLKNFDIENYKADTAIMADEVRIENPVFTIYRDKLPPFRGGVIKPLPVDAIKRITSPVSLSRINIENGRLSYIERNAQTRAEGTVFLTNINGLISNIKNRSFEKTDSLGFFLNGYLLDSAFIDLRVKQSYTDSLSGFLMTLRMKPTSLSFINPVLTPLSNVIITSGSVDSLHLRAIGKEHLALGEMNMYYHDLRIKLVKPGAPEKTTFKTRLITRIANTFVIRKDNKGRAGLVYFERLRDRSFFNYIVKMTFSGLATSVGLKKNRKYQRQYERELQNSNLPPINF